MTTPDLFSHVQKPHFNGPDYKPARDHARLTGQIERIFNIMRDGRWRTLRQIANQTGDPESSVSAQLRHLRKERFGGHAVDREYIADGLYQYRVIENANSSRK